MPTGRGGNVLLSLKALSVRKRIREAMITRPSIAEMFEGLVRNLEMVASGRIDDAAAFATPMLTLVDRIRLEWASWQRLIEEDNRDMEQTLGQIGVDLSDLQADDPNPESRNRTLKQAVVDAIEKLDLPAGPDAPAEQRRHDQTVLALLRRSLHRENQVEVAPPRVEPTSGNTASGGISLDALEGILLKFLANEMPGATTIQIDGLQRLAGGASREAWIFDVRWCDADEDDCFEPCIIMREPVSSVLVSDSSNVDIDGTRRTLANEIRVIQTMGDFGLPVPEILWFDTSGDWFERPFSIARRLPGTADVTDLLGTPAAGPMLDRFIELLGKIHALEPAGVGLDLLGRPSASTCAIEQVQQFEGTFDSQRLEPFPATSYIIRWLKKNPPEAGRVSIVHGDYRLGNFMHEDGSIIGILDWEQVHIGDPVEEIAFMYWSLWSMEPICPLEDFVQRYEAVTGTPVDRGALAYYRVFIEFKMLVVLLTGLRSYFATPERQLHYGGGLTTKMIRDAELRVIEELARGGPSVAFDAYSG